MVEEHDTVADAPYRAQRPSLPRQPSCNSWAWQNISQKPVELVIQKYHASKFKAALQALQEAGYLTALSVGVPHSPPL